METLDFQPKAHLFVCTRDRQGKKPCCDSKGSEDLVKKLKEWIKEEKLYFDIKVSKSSCLGYCESGISACFYPQNKWVHKIEANDFDQIKEMLINCTNK